uniref:Peptidase_M14 domain-containing protein n=1 Tax=Rhodnius prolixus TaxID=13249 RepID=T1I558_RHOPR
MISSLASQIIFVAQRTVVSVRILRNIETSQVAPLRTYPISLCPVVVEPVLEEDIKNEYGFHHVVKFRHHNYVQMTKELQDISKEYPNITRLYTIGKSVRGRDLFVLEIAEKPGVHIPGKPEVKYVANMHGNEVVGREMLLILARYLCENYGSDERVTHIVKSMRTHLLPSLNPDGYEVSHEGDYNGLDGRNNANNIDLNRNFPDQYGVSKVGFK